MRNRGGFTIIETLIVLGVTAVLFFMTMALISGKQGRTEFTQSMREIDARVRDVLNDVSNGYYPIVPNLICTVPAGIGAVPQFSYDGTIPDGTSRTGQNEDCVLAGKVIQIGVGSDSSATRIYSLAGRRLFTDLVTGKRRDVRSISELAPQVINVTSAGHTLNATEYGNLPSSIQLIKSDGVTKSYAVLGIYYQNFNGTTAGGQSTGTASVSIASLTPASYSEAAVITAAQAVTDATPFLPGDGSLVLCFKSGTSNQFAALTLRGASGGFTTELALDIDITAVPCI